MQARGAIDMLRWAIFALAALVAGQAALGFAGLFHGPPSALLALLVTSGVCVAAWRRGLLSTGKPLLAGWQPLETGLLVAVAATLASFVWVAAGRETFTYDSLSFHLYFPASWMHGGRLEIVPMVFGDVAPAYNPSNVELIVHLLMAPLRSGYLAECAQAPFAFVAALAIHATARELGASRAAALAGALAFLMIPEVRIQSSVSMVDLAVGALFLATLPFVIRLWRQPTPIDVIALAAAWGLFIGTKYIALPFSAPLFAAVAAVCWRHRNALARSRSKWAVGLAAAAVVLASGGFWYARNLAATGSPVFPLDTRILGVLPLHGLYGSDLMRAWDYHVPVARLDMLGGMLLGSGVGFCVAGAAALAVRWRGPETPLAFIQLAIFWLQIPYQHSRFLFGFFGVVAIAQAAATGAGRASRLCALLLAGAIAGSLIQGPEAQKLVPVAAGLAGAGLPWLERRLPLRMPAVAAALVFALAVASGLGPFRDRYPGYTYGPEFHAAWRWIHENVSVARIAYTGSNLPFPLYGKDLSNRVHYANVALGPRARVHDFPADDPPTSPEPTPYRKGANLDDWLANLRALEIDTLFVTAMFPIVLRNVEHDREDFPAERGWADAHPEIFRLRYATQGIRIYDVAGVDGRASSP